MLPYNHELIQTGSYLCSMDHHWPHGEARGYLPAEPLEIPEKTFSAIMGATPARGQLVMNKMALVFSKTRDIDDFASSILVVYRYDEAYFLTMLYGEKWAGAFGVKNREE